MPNFQNNIQRDSTGKVGINKAGDTIEQQLHIDGVIQIGNDFAGGNAVKIQRSPITGKLQKNEGAGWVDLGGANADRSYLPASNFSTVYVYSQTPVAMAANPINPGLPITKTTPYPRYVQTPVEIQSAPLTGISTEA